MSLGFRQFSLPCAALLLALVPACGSSGDDDAGDEAGGASSASSSASPSVSSPSAPASTPKGGTTKPEAGSGTAPAESPAPAAAPERNADGSPLEVTGRQLCRGVSAAVASRLLSLDVDSATPGDGATPQCTYAYTTAAGTDSESTLAAVRPTDIDGRTGSEAFDYLVELSRGLAGPVDIEEKDLPVGDKTVRLTGGGLHTGVVAAGGYLLTLTVPEADTGAADVDALLTAIGKALSP